MTTAELKTGFRVPPAVVTSTSALGQESGIAPVSARPADAVVATGSRARNPSTQLTSALEEALAWLRLTPLSDLPPSAIAVFTEAMPKVDLHRHLNGSIPIERLLAVAARHGIALPGADVESLRPHVQVTASDTTLPHYLRKFDVIGQVLKSPATIEALAAASIDDAARDNLAHVEIRFAPQYMAAVHGLPLEDVIKAVCRGVKRGVDDSGVTARLIVIVNRHAGVDAGAVVAQLAEKHRHLGVVAIDLAGDETHFPPGPFAKVFQDAKRAGLAVTVHAGETGSSANVAASVIELEADRIGHGVAAALDPAVVDLLRARGTIVEGCPTANAQVGAVASFEEHPLADFLRDGLRQVIATDNPSISGITLSSEFQRAIATFGLTLGEVERLIDNAIDGAFLTPLERTRLGKVVDSRLAGAEARLVRELDPEVLLRVLDATMLERGLDATTRSQILARIATGLATQGPG